MNNFDPMFYENRRSVFINICVKRETLILYEFLLYILLIFLKSVQDKLIFQYKGRIKSFEPHWETKLELYWNIRIGLRIGLRINAFMPSVP